VFATLKRLDFAHAGNSIHLPYEVVELPDGRMSSRKGNIVPITRLVQRMERVVRCLHLRQHEGTWTPEQIATVASQVARGAIKFGMLRVTNGRKIVFQMRDWLRLDGDSGPYIQFAHTRIASLLRRHPLPADAGNHWELLVAPKEVSLVAVLSRFNDVVTAACADHQPALLCHYLIRVARSFSSFYTECPFLTAGDPALLQARLALASATGRALRQGLTLLGIDAASNLKLKTSTSPPRCSSAGS
jgi:arginyl-tRNA synthetase